MNFTDLLYNPVYGVLGVPAVLTVGGLDYTLTAIDKTAGIQVGAGIESQTVLPAATVRTREVLALGLNRDQLDRAALVMNGRLWNIASVQPKPSPGGEADGELLLWLEGDE